MREVVIIYERCPFCGSLRRVDRGGIGEDIYKAELMKHTIMLEGRASIENVWERLKMTDEFMQKVKRKAKKFCKEMKK